MSFGDTSSVAGLGQIFAVHNDDNQVRPADGSFAVGDIAVAQFNETTGMLVKDVPVEGNNLDENDGFTINSSPVMTAPNAAGDRDRPEQPGARARAGAHAVRSPQALRAVIR